ncbi:MAG: malto-oligosyltrehalose trehalohydrolase [Candidatus Omnitrophota bacterium]
MKIGAYYISKNSCEFTVWAPFKKNIALKIVAPRERIMAMEKDSLGYWHTTLDSLENNTRYFYQIENKGNYPDPASFYQPDGPHAASAVIDHNCFLWEEQNWCGIRLEEMIIYELHTGTFTPEGTFAAVIDKLNYLCNLGINTIEIMPVSQFPGGRNWGYDGTYAYAVQNSYGGPEGLKRLVNACHKKGLAVILDVVYNHFGPEGNYLAQFGPYFTDKYKTPWGSAINYDGAYSSEVRNFIIANAMFWFEHYHIDALRLDAIHGIFDMSAKHILRELAEKTADFSKKTGRKFYLTAESDLNDIRVIEETAFGGYGVDAQWNDDFHHAVHTLFTQEKKGYYGDFGRLADLVTALREGFVYSWRYSKYRKRYHGSSSKTIPANRFLIFIQNHDQVGNRLLGERISSLVCLEAEKLLAGIVMLSPYIPLIFMGEEYGEDAPFLYFTSHTDKNLIEAVRVGRKNEFSAFDWAGDIPDPQSEDTFNKSKLCWEKLKDEKNKIIFKFYQELIMLRKSTPALSNLTKDNLQICKQGDDFLILQRGFKNSRVLCFMNFNEGKKTLSTELPAGEWLKILDSSEEKWRGPGSLLPETIEKNTTINTAPLSVAVYGNVKSFTRNQKTTTDCTDNYKNFKGKI